MKQRVFTGWHMTAIMVSFFTVVILVNLYMARSAIGTFGGTVVDNSYVASQEFNGWLAKGRAQAALGWSAKPTLDPQRHLILSVSKAGAPLAGISATATLRHPLGQQPEQKLQLRSGSAGQLVSATPIPSGRWTLHAEIRQNGQTMRILETVQ